MLSRNRWLSVVLLSLAAVLFVVGCGGGDDEGNGGGGAAATDQTLKWGLGAEYVLDPGLATDTTSAKLVLNIFDPLVKLDDELNAVPSMAESWDVKGPSVVYHLRSGAKWSNGDPVTAKDYEYAWKRALSPELGSDYSYQLYGIKGGVEYNECEKNCDKLKNAVAVKATDDQTALEGGPEYCWYSWAEQRRSLEKLLSFRFVWVLPGHGGRHRAISHDEMQKELTALTRRLAS